MPGATNYASPSISRLGQTGLRDRQKAPAIGDFSRRNGAQPARRIRDNLPLQALFQRCHDAIGQDLRALGTGAWQQEQEDALGKARQHIDVATLVEKYPGGLGQSGTSLDIADLSSRSNDNG